MSIILKPIRQKSGFCGPASLSSLLDYYGIKKSQDELAKLCETTAECGTPPEALIKVIKDLGFRVVAKNKGNLSEIDKLVQKDTPVLINWWSDYEKPADGHYSLVYKVSKAQVWLMDPELGGTRRISRQKLSKQWYDYFISGPRTGQKNDRWYLYISGRR